MGADDQVLLDGFFGRHLQDKQNFNSNWKEQGAVDEEFLIHHYAAVLRTSATSWVVLQDHLRLAN